MPHVMCAGAYYGYNFVLLVPTRERLRASELQRLRTRLSQWGGWSSALQSSVRFSLRVLVFDTFAGRGSQYKVCRGCAVSVTADESASSGGSDGHRWGSVPYAPPLRRRYPRRGRV